MKNSTLAAAIACTLFLTNASAQDKAATGTPPMGIDMGMGMGMGMGKQGSMPVQANMDKMQQQMDKIGTTTDPKERQRLMREHMQTMQENMKAMRDMAPGNQKGTERKPAAMANKKDVMQDGDLQKRQDMMESRMDMMNMMMEQMMERDKAMKPMGEM